ncbi:MAG: MnmA/TRMU family protein, partial [Ilumatobacteraceae bacterium]
SDDFQRSVVDPYVHDHARGVTPNPCIECNRHLKFDRLFERADVLGFDAVATGHHARVEFIEGVWRLLRGHDGAKDQSYVVHVLDQRRLARCLFPVGTMTKAEVRRHAERLGLRTAHKPDSQDVCFITSSGGRADFLRRRIELHPAEVVDQNGQALGEVESVELVTLGQRRGVAGGGGTKRFVVDVDVPSRRVVVGDESELLVDHEIGADPVWTDGEFEGDVLVQCSAHGEPRRGRVSRSSHAGTDRVVVAWDRPQRRVSPGQSLVFYDPIGDWVIGGATVTSSDRRSTS